VFVAQHHHTGGPTLQVTAGARDYSVVEGDQGLPARAGWPGGEPPPGVSVQQADWLINCSQLICLLHSVFLGHLVWEGGMRAAANGRSVVCFLAVMDWSLRQGVRGMAVVRGDRSVQRNH